MKLKVIEFFAGIGAQAQALKEAGIDHEIVATSDIDKYANIAYELLHGKVNNLGDIKEIKNLPNSDLWTYSFPCTDISLAGQMKGFDKSSETHSSLLWEIQRLLELSKARLPKFLLLENVKNLVSKTFMPNFKEWLTYLESLGYKNFWQIMNAKKYGIPQNRERVFMLSILEFEGNFIFPSEIELKVKLRDLLESDVSEKYFLSEKLIDNFTSLIDRNGFIRGLRFCPHDDQSEYAFTISTCPGSRATDNYIVCPAAVRGRKNDENKYDQNLEIRSSDCSNAITTVHKDSLVFMVQENTKKGYALAEVGDGVYTNRTDSKRGVVQRSKIPTLKTSPSDIGVVVEKEDLISIRRLTPREAWRLMGWKDENIDKVMNEFLSETQLYKMAGNSIVVNCLTEIFKQMKPLIKEVRTQFALNNIYNENSYVAIKSLRSNSLDLIIIDPPYVYKDYSAGNKGFDEKEENISFIKNISSGFDIAIFEEFKRVLKKMNFFCFCSKDQIGTITEWAAKNKYQFNILVWKKHGRPFGITYLHDLEFIIHIKETGAPYNGAYKSRLLEFSSSRKHHPTEKPLALIYKLIEYGSNEGDVVADFFLGSGTTTLAAKELGRQFIGFESDEKIFNIAKDRMDGIVGNQLTIFSYIDPLKKGNI